MGDDDVLAVVLRLFFFVVRVGVLVTGNVETDESKAQCNGTQSLALGDIIREKVDDTADAPSGCDSPSGQVDNVVGETAVNELGLVHKDDGSKEPQDRCNNTGTAEEGENVLTCVFVFVDLADERNVERQ